MTLRFTSLLFAILLLLSAGPAHASTASTTPTFTITADNITMGEKSTGTINFTLTSVNGFSGRIGMVCYGLDPNKVPLLVLPDCTYETQYYQLPANGSVSGSINLYPPWAQLPAPTSDRQPEGSSKSTLPAAAPLALAGLLALGIRHTRTQWLAAIALFTLAAVTGCMGSGGLAMTHGDWQYTLTGTPVSSTNAPITSDPAVTSAFDVTIN